MLRRRRDTLGPIRLHVLDLPVRNRGWSLVEELLLGLRALHAARQRPHAAGVLQRLRRGRVCDLRLAIQWLLWKCGASLAAFWLHDLLISVRHTRHQRPRPTWAALRDGGLLTRGAGGARPTQRVHVPRLRREDGAVDPRGGRWHGHERGQQRDAHRLRFVAVRATEPRGVLRPVQRLDANLLAGQLGVRLHPAGLRLQPRLLGQPRLVLAAELGVAGAHVHFGTIVGLLCLARRRDEPALSADLGVLRRTEQHL
mmetsp:Transcript_22971/g.76165  ORF Transcript_22971/g.76165 Transcript_22971/m.76165 type:complete len:255 (-) Transcript_22971:2299-3063(-)